MGKNPLKCVQHNNAVMRENETRLHTRRRSVMWESHRRCCLVAHARVNCLATMHSPRMLCSIGQGPASQVDTWGISTRQKEKERKGKRNTLQRNKLYLTHYNTNTTHMVEMCVWCVCVRSSRTAPRNASPRTLKSVQSLNKTRWRAKNKTTNTYTLKNITYTCGHLQH